MQEASDHPFVVKLAAVFNTETQVFMLMETTLGGISVTCNF